MSFNPIYTLPHDVLENANEHLISGFASNCDPQVLKYLINHRRNLVNWCVLFKNPHAIPILENENDPMMQVLRSDWTALWMALSSNPNAIQLLEKHEDKIDWFRLCSNPNAMGLIEKNIDKLCDLCWASLSMNPSAVSLLERNLDKVHVEYLSANPNAIPLLEHFINTGKIQQLNHELYWEHLSTNPNAIHILEQHLDKVDWRRLSANPNAIQLLEANLDKIDWLYLTYNPNAVRLLKDRLKNNIDFYWFGLGTNPNVAQIIGVLDTEKMREQCRPFACELAEAVFHPSRLVRLCEMYDMDLADYMELIGD